MTATRNRRPVTYPQNPRRQDRTPLLGPLTERVTTTESDVTALEAADLLLDGRIDALEALAIVEDGRLDALEADDVVVDGRLDALEANDALQDAAISGLITDVADHETRITALEGAPSGGDVVGPGSATDNALARYDGATGKLLQDSGALLDDSGNLTLPASSLLSLLGGQIKFPSTQVASADPNTLDDYEEGTWTPSMTFGGGSTGITYATQQGFYRKIGALVYVEARVVLSNKGSSTGVALIVTLPFTVGNTPLGVSDISDQGAGLLGSGGGATACQFCFPSGTSVYFGESDRNLLDDTNFTNATDMRIAATYYI